jgi:regulation of enolase protein 1 (concanavalin A-like superfamily)
MSTKNPMKAARNARCPAAGSSRKLWFLKTGFKSLFLGGVILSALFSMITDTMTTQATVRAWLNQPSHWNETGDTLNETVPSGTDYWRVTHYGFIRDNGPFRYQEQGGNFEAKVRIRGKYHELYHQAGLMIRIDEENWIKAGIEFVNAVQNLSAVVTRGFSDWSVLARSDNPAFIWLRLQRYNDTVQISYSLDNQEWAMIRLAFFPPQVPVKIGMVAAAPGKEPFEVTFDHFSIGALLSPPKED